MSVEKSLLPDEKFCREEKKESFAGLWERIEICPIFCYAFPVQKANMKAGKLSVKARQEIVIPVRLDEKAFRRFARFDMLVLRKRWLRPAVFALFSRLPQSGLIAAVLLSVGLGLPIVYICMFLFQVREQAVKWKLGKGRPVYTLTIRTRDFSVVSAQKAGEATTVLWSDACQAYRMRGCIYLYASPVKAFLLPDGQANASDAEVWSRIVQGLGKDKCRVSLWVKHGK